MSAIPESIRCHLRRRRRWIIAGLVLAHVLGILSSIDALMSTRTAPGAVAWIVSLSTFPYVAVPSYWLFGRARFQGYPKGLDPQARIETDPPAREVRVESALDEGAFLAVLSEAGYPDKQ